jgi:hypothetical protein
MAAEPARRCGAGEDQGAERGADATLAIAGRGRGREPLGLPEVDLRSPYTRLTIVLHPALLEAERSELNRAFCSSLSEL